MKKTKDKIRNTNEYDFEKGLENFLGNNDDSIKKEDYKEIMQSWLSDEFIDSKTRLNGNQIIALTILKTLSEKYNVSCIKSLIKDFTRYKLSENGQSSKELVDILRSRDNIENDDQLMKAIEPFIK